MRLFATLLLLLSLPLPPALSATLIDDDVRWLNRITYGIDSATAENYLTLGRKRYLDTQLNPKSGENLPEEISAAITRMNITQKPVERTFAEFEQENQRIRALPENEKETARKAHNETANRLAQEAMQRHLYRALYAPAQLREQMTWFWLNHFNVFRNKANIRILVGDYEEYAIRPHALGRFRDLLRATLHHPAMLLYLDNTRNAAGKINENYARELLELHTLGVDGGYSQQDVQGLARILTGFGVNWDAPPKLKKEFEPLYRQSGGFEFHPARHDFGDKTLLGVHIAGEGYEEIEKVLDLLARHPATARFVCRKLAIFFVSDAPPEKLVERMATTFRKSDGNIAATLRTLFESREFAASLGKKFKDPLHYLAATLRFAYDRKQITNLRPAVNWLNALGQPLYGKPTPDGYAMTEKDWASPGQLAKRFEIAKTIGGGNAGLFDAEDGMAAKSMGFPMLSTKLFYQAIEPGLSRQTTETLDKAASQQEWNAFLLSAPEFMYR